MSATNTRGRFLGRPRLPRCIGESHPEPASGGPGALQPSGRSPPPRPVGGAIDDHHHLSALAPAGQPHCLAPFLAGTKVASMKACPHSSFPASSKVPGNVVQMRSHTPMCCHSWRRRWQVESLPYRLGMSCHRAPDRSTQRIPLKVRLSSALRRPRLLGGGSRGLRSSHWASAKSPAMVATP